mgnify:CR=1 FL=1
MHSFTNPASGFQPERGVAYNEKADRKSWRDMKVFFEELLHYKLTLPTNPQIIGALGDAIIAQERVKQE